MLFNKALTELGVAYVLDIETGQDQGSQLCVQPQVQEIEQLVPWTFPGASSFWLCPFVFWRDFCIFIPIEISSNSQYIAFFKGVMLKDLAIWLRMVPLSQTSTLKPER